MTLNFTRFDISFFIRPTCYVRAIEAYGRVHYVPECSSKCFSLSVPAKAFSSGCSGYCSAQMYAYLHSTVHVYTAVVWLSTPRGWIFILHIAAEARFPLTKDSIEAEFSPTYVVQPKKIQSQSHSTAAFLHLSILLPRVVCLHIVT